MANVWRNLCRKKGRQYGLQSALVAVLRNALSTINFARLATRFTIVSFSLLGLPRLLGNTNCAGKALRKVSFNCCNWFMRAEGSGTTRPPTSAEVRESLGGDPNVTVAEVEIAPANHVAPPDHEKSRASINFRKMDLIADGVIEHRLDFFRLDRSGGSFQRTSASRWTRSGRFSRAV